MQRAAAAASEASPTISQSTTDSVASSNGRSPKRQKQSHDGGDAVDTSSPSVDAAAAQAALAEVEAKRQKALALHMRDRGETKWAFSYRAEERQPPESLRVERVGYAGLGPVGGRREGGRLTYGKFKTKKKQEVSCSP